PPPQTQLITTTNTISPPLPQSQPPPPPPTTPSSDQPAAPLVNPDLCFSAVVTIPGAAESLTTQKDVIEASINLTCSAVQCNFFTVDKLIKSGKNRLKKREMTALHDCLETIDETLDELHVALRDLNEYPNKKPLTQHAADLKTLLSSRYICLLVFPIRGWVDVVG
ncbi:Pectinesterase 3, partial [Linum perenne]